MPKSLAVLLIAAAAILVPAPLLATVIPPIGLTPGSQYQLIFVTADIHDALSNDITIYNTFVTDQAALGVPSGLPSGATWNAVGSTDFFDANANAPSGTLPVYNTAGELVTGAGVGIYTGVLDNLVGYDQYGDVATAAQDLDVWTGSDYEGFGIVDATLGAGSGDTEFGRLALDTTWLEFGVQAQHTEIVFRKPFYALSTELTVPLPEPGTLALLGMAFLLIGGRRILRRRRGGDLCQSRSRRAGSC